MKIPMAFLRVFFVILSLFFMTAFMVTLPFGFLWQRILIGLGVGALFSAVLVSLETLFRRYNLKAFNTVILGLFFGYLMGQALVVISNSILTLSHLHSALQPQTLDLIKTSFFLFGTYLGTFLTIHFSDEIHLSIPFVKLSQHQVRKKDLIMDSSVLADTRILDLAATGLIDNALVMPSFIIKELCAQAELGDDILKARAKRCLETIKKLETFPALGVRLDETNFAQSIDAFANLIRLARLTDANILTCDLSQVQAPSVEGIRIINLNSLSNALKPLMQTGETMRIKVQRFGKEPNQGVGYLDDGTMVVINGGGDYIGENADVQVLSVKHTTSGRMIFCNMIDHIGAKGNRVEV